MDNVLDIASHTGVIAHCGPTGSGKSLTGVAAARLRGGRFAYLTATKGLQDMVATDFEGVADMRGQANYICDLEIPKHVPSNEAVCRFGVACGLKASGCAYYAAYRKANAMDMVTNYSCWFNVSTHGLGFGGVNTLILDEAHTLSDELSKFQTMEIADEMFDAYLGHDIEAELRAGKLDESLVPRLANARIRVGQEIGDALGDLAQMGHRRRLLKRLSELRRIRDTVENMIQACHNPSEWVLQPGEGLDPFRIVPLRPNVSLLNAPNVVLMSATITPKFVEMLGLSGVHWTSGARAFPAAQRPITLVPTAQMRHGMSAEERAELALRIDQAARARLPHKGIVHTGSYELARFLQENCESAPYFITHTRQNATQKIAEFKAAKKNAILVSPVVTTGWDFPGPECEWQIIAKISWPNPTDPVVAARLALDRDYMGATAMQTLVQACGRGNRLESDYCQTLILDNSANRLLKRYSAYAPQWFLDAVTHEYILPKWPL